jgi:hypothetical protein
MPTAKRALISPQADFWLLGGLSLLVPLVLVFIPEWNGLHTGLGLAGWSLAVVLALNAPHFAFSYQVFYDGFRRRLSDAQISQASKARMIVAGIIAPAALLVYFGIAMAIHSMAMLGVITNAMLGLSAWHYARQGYGTLITTSAYRGIFYGPKQKFILNANAYLMPAYVWILFNSGPHANLYHDVPFADFDFSRAQANAFLYPAAVFLVLSIGVFLRKWLVERRGLPVNGVLGYACSIYIWILLMRVSPNFYFLAPVFHGLQYMPFVYKFRQGEAAREAGIAPAEIWQNKQAMRSMVTFGLAGLVLGATFMYLLPAAMDAVLQRYHPAPPDFTRNFFLVSFVVFINIHHFFIDYAFWRRDNSDVQQYLFQA